jgi:hypothetical protein
MMGVQGDPMHGLCYRYPPNHESVRPEIEPDDFRLEAGKYYITATGERVGPMELRANAFRTAQNPGQWWWKDGEAPAGTWADIVALAADQESKP